MTTIRVRDRIRTIIETICDGVYEKEEAVRLALLACIAGESIFLLGPPGVAKSLIARRVKFAFRDATSFEYLMGRFSTPEEIFGPISISKLRDEDRYERIVDNYLPTADIVFLDEVWKASPPIQNALLTALNERLYRNGSREIHLPMKGFIAASNELPASGEGLDAFWDRFLIRMELGSIQDDGAFEQMVRDTRDVYDDHVPEQMKIRNEEYRSWQEEIDSVQIGNEIISIVSDVRTRIRESNLRLGEKGLPTVFVSDRRWKKIFHILRASAFLNGRIAVDPMDCFVISHTIWNTKEQIEECRSIVHDAIRKHGYTTSVDAGAIASRLATLKQDVERSTLTVTEEEQLVPEVYDGEYLRIIDFVSDKEVRLWKGDFDALAYGMTAPLELFYFNTDGTFSHSETHDISAAPGGNIAIDGESCRIETQKKLSTVAVASAPNEADIRKWNGEADALLAEARDILERITKYATAEKEDAEANLFVPRALTEVAFTNLRSAQKQIARLTVDIDESRASFDSLS